MVQILQSHKEHFNQKLKIFRFVLQIRLFFSVPTQHKVVFQARQIDQTAEIR